MLFNSFEFLVFLPIVFGLYWLLGRRLRLQNLLVVVASYNYTHARLAVQALDAGKHVLCEKPFGFTTADVDSMTSLAASKGLVLQPFQQRRFQEYLIYQHLNLF